MSITHGTAPAKNNTFNLALADSQLSRSLTPNLSPNSQKACPWPIKSTISSISQYCFLDETNTTSQYYKPWTQQFQFSSSVPPNDQVYTHPFCASVTHPNTTSSKSLSTVQPLKYCSACLRCCQQHHFTHFQKSPRSSKSKSKCFLFHVKLICGIEGLYRIALSTLLLLLISSHWLVVLCHLPTTSSTPIMDNATHENRTQSDLHWHSYTLQTSVNPFTTFFKGSLLELARSSDTMNSEQNTESIDNSSFILQPFVIGLSPHLLQSNFPIIRNARSFARPESQELTKSAIHEICGKTSVCERLRMLFTKRYYINSCQHLYLMDVILSSTDCQETTVCNDTIESVRCDPLEVFHISEFDRWSKFFSDGDIQGAWIAWRQLLWIQLDTNCHQLLTNFLDIDGNTSLIQAEFSHLMGRYFYDTEDEEQVNATTEKRNSCLIAYRQWICSVNFAISFPLRHSPAISQRVPACDEWCSNVEMKCPYLPPIEKEENGGEPAFLCNVSHYSADPKALSSLLCNPEQCCYSTSRFKLPQQSSDVNCSSNVRLCDVCGAETYQDEVYTTNLTLNATSSASSFFTYTSRLHFPSICHLDEEFSLLLFWMTSSHFLLPQLALLLLWFGALVILHLIKIIDPCKVPIHGVDYQRHCSLPWLQQIHVSICSTSRPCTKHVTPTAQLYWKHEWWMWIVLIGMTGILSVLRAGESDGFLLLTQHPYHKHILTLNNLYYHKSASINDAYLSCNLSKVGTIAAFDIILYIENTLSTVARFLWSAAHSLSLFIIRTVHMPSIVFVSLGFLFPFLSLNLTWLSWLT